MIRSFRCPETERIFRRQRSRRLPVDIQRTALRNLLMIHAAVRLDDLRVPPGNILVARNICRGKWLEVCWHATMDALTLRDNLTEGDPRFENEPAGDFRLKADSPAWKLGFQRIPLEQIGLVKDEFRKELPRSAARTD